MAKPKRTFSGQEGQRSTGTAGPEAIKYDFDNLFAALDPADTFQDGSPGGIGAENMKPNAATDDVIGDRTINQAATGMQNKGTLTNLLSWLAGRIKAITGKTNWYDTPDTTLAATKAHIDSAAPHSGHETPSGAQAKVDAHENKAAPHSGHVKSINTIQGGDITLKAGANVIIGQNTTTKEITISTSGTIAPSAHASSHAISGGDTITPAMIGAALASHDHPWGDITEKPSSFTPSSHTHPWSQVTSAPATATRWPSWSEVTSKPSTFTPSSHTHSKSDVGLGSVQNYGIATQAQAQAGTANNVYMTPLRVKEAINKTIVTGTYTGTGTGNRDINIGFQPKTVFVILLNSAGSFIVIGGTGEGLHISPAEVAGNENLKTTANGFTVGGATGTFGNRNGRSYLWIAFP